MVTSVVMMMVTMAMSVVPMVTMVHRGPITWRTVILTPARRTVILASARRTVVLRLGISSRRVVLLVIIATAQQPAQQSTARTTMMMAALAVLVAVLKLVLDGVGGDGAGNTAEDLAHRAVAHLASQEGAAGAAHCRGEEAAILLLAVRADGAALPVVLISICPGRVCGLGQDVVGVCRCRSRR